jgi:hypothetical protein
MKHNSDIFICKRKKDDYWAYPSPFVAHGGGFEIQFRNLTDDAIEIDFGNAPVHKQVLSLGPRATDSVVVNGDAGSGLFVYEAEVKPRTTRSSVPRTAKKRRKPGAIFVRGGSPPEIIIDT